MTPLKRLRTQRGITQEAVEEGTGIDQSLISRIENGAPTTPERAKKLADFFGRDAIDELQILYPERYPESAKAGPSQKAAA